MLGVRLNKDAGRAAYLAGFHAAQAFIFESVGKMFKTHKGVQTEFLRLTKDDPRFKHDLRIFCLKPITSRALPITKKAPAPKFRRNARRRLSKRRRVSLIVSLD
jgi:hypothetical protein